MAAEAELETASPPIEETEELPPEGNTDDLTLIAGVGPKYAAVLQEHGFNTFAQLSACAPEELAEIFTTVSGRTPDFESWIEQAQSFQAGE